MENGAEFSAPCHTLVLLVIHRLYFLNIHAVIKDLCLIIKKYNGNIGFPRRPLKPPIVSASRPDIDLLLSMMNTSSVKPFFISVLTFRCRGSSFFISLV